MTSLFVSKWSRESLSLLKKCVLDCLIVFWRCIDNRSSSSFYCSIYFVCKMLPLIWILPLKQQHPDLIRLAADAHLNEIIIIIIFCWKSNMDNISGLLQPPRTCFFFKHVYFIFSFKNGQGPILPPTNSRMKCNPMSLCVVCLCVQLVIVIHAVFSLSFLGRWKHKSEPVCLFVRFIIEAIHQPVKWNKKKGGKIEETSQVKSNKK